MFKRGKVLKVRIDLSSDMVGFGRATIVESVDSRLLLSLANHGQEKALPQGTRIWFVGEAPDNSFNGLWSTIVTGSDLIEGETVAACTPPKFEAVVQKRKHQRVTLKCSVHVEGEAFEKLNMYSRNISAEGMALVAPQDCSERFTVGHNIDLVAQTADGPLILTARVVQRRFNWLSDTTDIGLEFVSKSDSADLTLKSLLSSLAQPSRNAPLGKDGHERMGKLSAWLKSNKDNVSFVRGHQLEATDMLSQADLDELQLREGAEGNDPELGG